MLISGCKYYKSPEKTLEIRVLASLNDHSGPNFLKKMPRNAQGYFDIQDADMTVKGEIVMERSVGKIIKKGKT